MSDLNEDCLYIIFSELNDDLNSLYSCILVNRFWCTIGVQILWKTPYETLTNHYYKVSINNKASNRSKNNEYSSFNKFYNMIINLLPASSKLLLIENDVILILTPYSNKPLFNYISFYSHFPMTLINDIGRALIKENNSHKYQEKYKILEKEFYKLFINNCKNIIEFHWVTTLPLYQYPGASTFFSQLYTLSIKCCKSSVSENLIEMAKICQNIEDLEVWDCEGDIPGLTKFIDNQKNLQSLALHCKYQEITSIQLSEVIERKAGALKELIIQNVLLTPKSFSLLINLEYLNFSNDYGYNEQELQELQNYLSIASFPKLQYLITRYLPRHEVCMLIENSHGNIKKISIRNHQNLDYTKRLFKAISRNCPNLECLKINIQFENLNGIKEILLNCTKLNKLHLRMDDIEEDNCDEILNILADCSPKTFKEFSFNEDFIFSATSLRNFFERWRGRIPIKFVTRFDKCYHFTQEHIKVVEKYFEEGVIDRETKYLYL